MLEYFTNILQYGDYVVNGSYLTGVSPYDGIKAASSGCKFTPFP